MNKLILIIVWVLILTVFLLRFNSCGCHSPLPQLKSDTSRMQDTVEIHDTI